MRFRHVNRIEEQPHDHDGTDWRPRKRKQPPWPRVVPARSCHIANQHEQRIGQPNHANKEQQHDDGFKHQFCFPSLRYVRRFNFALELDDTRTTLTTPTSRAQVLGLLVRLASLCTDFAQNAKGYSKKNVQFRLADGLAGRSRQEVTAGECSVARYVRRAECPSEGDSNMDRGGPEHQVGYDFSNPREEHTPSFSC